MSPLKKIKVRSIQNNIVVKKPVTWKHWLSLILFFVLLAVIFIGGPASSRYIKESDRKAVDKNSAIVKALVYSKSSHRGNTIYFMYFYKEGRYKASESGSDFYDNLECGDNILIKIDTLDPENAYIIE
jgi:hypothetical protein